MHLRKNFKASIQAKQRMESYNMYNRVTESYSLIMYSNRAFPRVTRHVS